MNRPQNSFPALRPMKKLLLSCTLSLGALLHADVLSNQYTDNPAEGDTTELTQRRGVYTQYSMGLNPNFSSNDNLLPSPIGPYENSPRLRWASESFPREPAQISWGPAVVQNGNNYEIRFELSEIDDVRVRILNAQNHPIKLLGSGVIGLQWAAEPFQANSLTQTLVWDGKDDQGQTAAPGWRVELSVGLEPVFDRFVGYDPLQPTAYLSGLQVDNQGRVYLALSTQNRSDPILVRADRNGNYVDTVYPSNPEELQAQGKTLDDVYENVQTYIGREVPILESLWRTHFSRFDGFIKFPFVISKGTGKGYFVEGLHRYAHPPKYSYNGVLAHVYDVNLDNFFFKPWNADGEFGSSFVIPGQYKDIAVDKDGYIYLLMGRLKKMHNSVELQDSNQWGTVTKIDPNTWEGVKSFTWHGNTSLSSASAYLGKSGHFGNAPLSTDDTGATFESFFYSVFVNHTRYQSPPSPWSAADHAGSFLEPEEIEVDDQGNLYVIDGIPRRIKMYEPNGKWIGEVQNLTVNGNDWQFFDLISIADGPGNITYVLSSFWEDKNQAYLLKVENLTSNPSVIWSVPLDPLSRYIGVDSSTATPRIWVGNGNGRATFTSVDDEGASTNNLQHFGGFRQGIISDPWHMTVSEDGKLFIYDYDRHEIIRTNDDTSDWKTVDADPPSPGLEYNARFRRYGYGYDTELRGSEGHVKSMFFDDARQRLWVSYDRGFGQNGGIGGAYLPDQVPSLGYDHFDVNLNRVNLTLANNHTPNYAERWAFNASVSWADGFGDKLLEIPYDGSRGTWWGKSEDSSRVYVDTKVRNLSNGSFASGPVISLGMSGGSACFDSRGNVYVLDIVPMSNPSRADILFGFPNHHAYWQGYNGTPDNYHFWRGNRPVQDQTDVIEVAKFGPNGGQRGQDEQWSHRGAGFINNFCGNCSHHGNMLASNDSDHIFVGDPIHHCVKVLDPAGNLVQWIGRYGNADIYPAGGESARELGFHNVFTIASNGDDLYVVDRDLKRVAKVSMAYRQTAIGGIGIGDDPVAVAGADQTIADSDNDGFATVQVDGSFSYDNVGITSYEWKEGSTVLATTAQAQFDLPVGPHTLTLLVKDADNNEGTDTIDVNVTAFVNQPPVADAGADQVIADDNGNGQALATLDASGSTDDLGMISSYAWSDGNGRTDDRVSANFLLPVGLHTFTLTVTDHLGATDTDTVIIDIRAPSAGSATVVDAEGAQGGASGDSSFNLNLSNDSGSSANYLVVTTLTEVGHISALSYAGQNMDLLAQAVEGAAHIRVYGISNPASSGQLTCTVSGSIYGSQILSYSYLTGVDTTNPVRTSGTATNPSGGASLTVSTTAQVNDGDVALLSVNGNNTQGYSAQPGDTVLFEGDAGASFSGMVQLDEDLSEGAYSNQITFTDGNSRQLALLVVLAGEAQLAQPVPDTDGDGIPDWFEKQHSGSDTGLDPNVDGDADGYTHMEEWKFMTEPGDGTDYFSPDMNEILPQKVELFWRSAAGRVYQVDHRYQLQTSWENLSGWLKATPPQNSFIHWREPGEDSGFYRIGVEVE